MKTNVLSHYNPTKTYSYIYIHARMYLCRGLSCIFYLCMKYFVLFTNCKQTNFISVKWSFSTTKRLEKWPRFNHKPVTDLSKDVCVHVQFTISEIEPEGKVQDSFRTSRIRCEKVITSRFEWSIKISQVYSPVEKHIYRDFKGEVTTNFESQCP